jgi:GNAT superfamily N-acetyltransferase
MPELKSLDNQNFHHFISLLKERGEAPEDYYRWKYLAQPSNGQPTGYIAYYEDKPVGCIGIINRQYHAADGMDYPATWFADWFVSDKVRGKGIGEKLMKEVSKIGIYNFGIPGPAKAQQVCENTGYISMTGLYIDNTIYLRPFICGYLRGGGSKFKRFLRGGKNLVRSISSIRTLSVQEPAVFRIDPQLDYKALISEYQFNQQGSRALQKTEEFIPWIQLMPIRKTSERYWWTIKGMGFYSWGFFEKDFWGLSKAVIFEISYHHYEEKFISIICKTLLKHGVDLVKYVSSAGMRNVMTTYQYPLPLYYSGPLLPSEFSLTNLDKESSWREFAMK